MAIGRGDIEIDKLYNTDNLWRELQTDYNIFTTVIDKNTVTCSSAYNTISTQLNGRINSIMTAFCNSVGYDSTTLEQQQCKNQFSSLFNNFISSGVNDSQIVSSYIAAKAMVDLAANNGDIYAKTLAERNMVGSQLGAGSLGEIYLPYIQSLMSVLLVCLFPVVVLLMLIAPVESFKWYFGMYIWILMWGLIDVIFNTIIQDKAYTIFTEFRNSGGLGLENLLNLNSYSVKILSMYSNMRWMGASLSAAMAYGILKFGGHALATIAGSIGSSVQSAGASVGQALAMPGGSARLQEEAFQKAVMASKDIRQMFTVPNVDSQVTSRVFDQHSRWGYANRLSENFGGAENAGKVTSNIRASDFMANFNKAAAFAKVFGNKFLNEDGSFNYGKFKDWERKGMVLDEDMAETLRDKTGYDVQEGQKISEFALTEDGDLAFLIAKKEGGGVSVVTSGLGTKVEEVKDGALFNYLLRNGKIVSGEGTWDKGFSLDNLDLAKKLVGVKPELLESLGFWGEALKNTRITGKMKNRGDGTYLLENVQITSTDGKVLGKTSTGGHMIVRENDKGEYEIVGAAGIEFYSKENENQRLKIANMVDGTLIDATYTYGNIDIDKKGTQYTIKETLKEDMNKGGYKVLAGSKEIQTLAEDGNPMTVIDGTFKTKDGKTFAGKATFQNGKLVFIEGESGYEFQTESVNTHISDYTTKVARGTQYEGSTVAWAALKGDSSIATRLIKFYGNNVSLDSFESSSQSINFSDFVREIYDKTGVDIGGLQSGVSGGAGIAKEGLLKKFIEKIGGIKIQAEALARMINTSEEREIVNFWTRADQSFQDAAFRLALEKSRNSDGEIDKEKFNDVFASSLNYLRKDAINTAQELLKDADPSNYGKSSLFSPLKRLAEYTGLKDTEVTKLKNYAEESLKSKLENLTSKDENITPTSSKSNVEKNVKNN